MLAPMTISKGGNKMEKVTIVVAAIWILLFLIDLIQDYQEKKKDKK
jgi:preprotein translocase subunit SecG